jgi:hypothetical protein
MAVLPAGTGMAQSYIGADFLVTLGSLVATEPSNSEVDLA